MSDDDVEEALYDDENKLAEGSVFELYRKSTLGICLTEALDELITNGSLTPELAHKVLAHFDRVSFYRCFNNN